jgi:hypothetical protein
MILNTLGIPQLYGELIGWWQFDVWWAIIKSSGLFYIPIIYIFMNDIVEPFLSQDYRAGSVTSTKRLIVKFCKMIFILFIFIIPSVGIHANAIEFQAKGKTNTVFDNSSTYSQNVPSALTKDSLIQMPIGFYLWLNLVTGATTVAYDKLSDATTIREAQQIGTAMLISNVKLRQEYAEFLNDCYLPSYADMTNDIKNGNTPSDKDFKQCINTSAMMGVFPIGCNFNRTSNKFLIEYYYPKYYSHQPIKGFKFNPVKGSPDEIANQATPKPKYGSPRCDAWWGAANPNSLRNRLYNDLNSQWMNMNPKKGDLISYFKSIFSTSYSQNELEDGVIDIFLQKSFGGAQFIHQYYTEGDYLNNNKVGNWESWYGNFYQKYIGGFAAFMSSIVAMLPLIQMYLMVATLASLPIASLFACYSMKYVVSALATLFCLITMTYYWHLVSFIDNFVRTSIEIDKHTSSNILSNMTSAILGDGYSTGSSQISSYLDYVTAFIYLVFPTVVTGMIAWGGAKVGGAIDQGLGVAKDGAGQTQKGAEAANSQGIGILKQIARKIL